MTAKQIAQKHCVMRVLVGSRLYGINNDNSDYDYLGACIEPPSHVVGLHQFEQWVREGANGETIYSLRKLCRLLLKGNPTVTEILWAPERFWTHTSRIGTDLRDMRRVFLSQKVLHAYLGYLREQIERLEGRRGQMNVNRAEIIAAYGYDVKYAAHIVRLAIMATILGRTGSLVLPLADKHRAIIRDIRAGGWNKDEVLVLAANHEREIKRLLSANVAQLPSEPQHELINAWLVDVYRKEWDRRDEQANTAAIGEVEESTSVPDAGDQG